MTASGAAGHSLETGAVAPLIDYVGSHAAGQDHQPAMTGQVIKPSDATKRLHNSAPFVCPPAITLRRTCYGLTVATLSDSVVCEVESWLSHLIRVPLRHHSPLGSRGDVGNRLALSRTVQFFAALAAPSQMQVIEHQTALEKLECPGRVNTLRARA